MNAYGMVLQTLNQWSYCGYFDVFIFFIFGFEVLCFIFIVENGKNKVLKFDMMCFP